jgi:flagellar export protein FliJ
MPSMAFRFRFRTLLRYREHLRTKAQTDLAFTIKQCEAVQSRLEEAQSERRRQVQNLEEKCSTGIKSRDYLLSFEYIGSLERQLLHLENKIEELSQEVVKAKEILLQRQTEVKMLECLEAKDRSVYRKEQGKRELIMLDEKARIGSSRHQSDQ